MNRGLVAGTDAGSFILCDAAFARGLEKASVHKLEPHVVAGDVLLYSFGGDGEVRMCLLLDENLPEEFQPKVCKHQRDLLLRIPNGRLLLCGLEETGIATEKLLAHRVAAANGTAEVPPGNYLAQAYELDWGDEPDARAAEERARIIHSSVSRIQRTMTNIMGVAALLGFFGTPVALFIAYRAGGWMTCGQTLGVIVILYLLFCGLAWLLNRHPSHKAYDEAAQRQEEILSRFPKVVVQLKRAPDEMDLTKLKGGKFGAGFR
jgi:hypothetical protein